MTSPDLCAQQLLETIPELMHAIRSHMRQNADARVTVPQLRCLLFLRRHPGCSLGDIAKHLGVTTATTSTMVDRIVKQGLIKVTVPPDDRRRISLELSEQGATIVRHARDETLIRISEALTTCSSEQLEQIHQALEVLRPLFRRPDGS
ncbi:MarR family transcriptional regulator [Crenobacter sp. SG2303]|uniref:MarR family transcriptional regulator n=1 Tax=Crenobacter oryzisoli TaxID=3056844 RepID=A0ABT7XT38_9NEIS|nr:MarR family transcriptional regulator [Crenobacter sp. SG2303]MDN0076967.1 MarR family transcriptional regulator [Crenobacter sp. SG2303]